MLSEENKQLSFEKEFTGSTENVLMSVLLNKADAGAIFNTELGKASPDVQGQIRTLLKTQKIPSHPLSAHPRVPRSVRTAVKEAVLSLSAQPGGAELFKSLRLASPVEADYARDYHALEDVDVKGLSNWGQ